MVWMFVGASPGSTGGGIKTTTLVVLLGVIAAITRNDSRVVVLRRTVSLETVYRSAAIVTIYTLVAALGAVALLATQRQPLDVLLFEVASAIGTVGLSLGATQELDGLGKLVIIGLMFIGRVGPLTLVLLMGRTVASGVRYPESPIIVG
jgi:trk system potassium uptake protein TrkH